MKLSAPKNIGSVTVPIYNMKGVMQPFSPLECVGVMVYREMYLYLLCVVSKNNNGREIS